MKNTALFFIAVVITAIPYGCIQQEPVVQPKLEPAVKMTSSKAPETWMLEAVGISSNQSNTRMAQLYREEAAVVATYEGTEGVSFLFIPYQDNDSRMGVFPFYEGEYIPFRVDLEKSGDDIKVITDASEATYIMEGNMLKAVEFTRLPQVKTADQIKEMRMEQRVDSAIEYYMDCMDALLEQGAWYCGGCATGQLLWSIGCMYFTPCSVGSQVTCIGLAILDRFR